MTIMAGFLRRTRVDTAMLSNPSRDVSLPPRRRSTSAAREKDEAIKYANSALLEKLHALQGLKDDTTYIHCCTLNDTEWKLIKDTGGQVSLAVPIEMAMGHGLPPIQDALDHGIRPSLSSDVDVTMAQDPFTIMRAAFTLPIRAGQRDDDLPAQS